MGEIIVTDTHLLYDKDSAHHEDNADLYATDVKEIAYNCTMELVLSHHESRCIRYQ